MIGELAWDTAFFGRKIGRLREVPSGHEISGLLERAAAEGFAYLTCRVSPSRMSDVQMLERHGFYLSDIAITWAGRTDAATPPRAGRARPADAADREGIMEISKGIFTDGRFYHDPFFSREEADRLYREWAGNLLRGLADRVFFIDQAGFIGCSMRHGSGDIPLVGVASGQQGRGVGSELMASAMAWFRQQGAGEVTVRTQIGNRAAIRLYERCGFVVKDADITMARILAGTPRG